MNKLTIRKKTSNVFWHYHNDLEVAKFSISDFQVSIDSGVFQIIEINGARRFKYLTTNVTIIDETTSATYIGLNEEALLDAFLLLNYTPFLKTLSSFDNLTENNTANRVIVQNDVTRKVHWILKSSINTDTTASHYKGNYNILTNTPVLVNGVGQLGDEYKCTVSGVRDFGAGNITVGINDILAYNGSIYFLKVNNNQSGGGGSQTLQQVLQAGNTATTDLNISVSGIGSSISTSNIKHSLDPTNESTLTGKKIKSKSLNDELEVEAGIGISFKDTITGKIQKIKKTTSISNDADFSLPNKTGNQVFAAVEDLKQIYKTISSNTTLDDTFHDAICFISTTCTITIPSGLRPDFACVFDAVGALTGTFVSSGSTISAPFGSKLANNSLGSCVTIGFNSYRLNGGFST